MSDVDPIALQLNGPWVGETMGCDSPAHLWEIKVITFGATFRHASITTRWEGETKQTTLTPSIFDEEGTALLEFGKDRRMMWIDRQHFVIPKWDTNDIRHHKGRAYDVVFSRPGVSELTAKDAYRRYLKIKPSAPRNSEIQYLKDCSKRSASSARSTGAGAPAGAKYSTTETRRKKDE